MKKNIRRHILCLSICLLVGCASPKATVLPYEDSVRPEYKGPTPEEADKVAIESAREYCHAANREMIIISRTTNYVGSINETANNTLTTAKTDVPSFSLVGKVIGAFAEKNPYMTQITFQCK